VQEDEGPRAASEEIRPLPEAAAGAGLGLLVGLLLGLSVSQVVGGVIAALSALLAGFLGLTTTTTIQNRAWRIGAFGLFCVAGVLAGLAVRSGSLLAPSVQQDVAQWQGAGYPKEQALAYVAFARLGVKPEGVTLSASPAPGAGSNVLFADKAGVCARLERLPAAAQLRILSETGEAYAALAAASEAAGNPEAALAAGLKSLCG
jgi:hypothetical protein